MAEHITKSDLEKVRFYCRKDLQYLCKTILGYKDWSQVHLDLARFMRRAGNRIHIELPRGHLKSSVITIGWTIQQILENPDLRILICNATWDNSREFLRTIQAYLAPDGILPVYFGNFQSSHWNQDAITVRQRTRTVMGPTIATTGIEKEKTSQHYEIIVVDDLVGPENVETPEQRRKVYNYYMSLFDLLEPNGRIVVIGTRYHQDDLYAKIIEENDNQKNWSLFIRSAYKDDGSLLFPEKFTHAILNEKKNRPRGAYHFASQYLNNPIDESTADFKQEWIKYYEPGTPHPSNLYLSVDPAHSLSRDADYSAFIVAGMYADRKIRVVDYVRRRVVPSDLVDIVFDLVKKWGLHRVGIETFAFQKTLKYDIERQQKENGIFFSIDELGRRNAGKGEPILSKEARIRRLQPYFEQGLIEIRGDMQDLVGELVAFPRGKTDDLIDALSYQLDHLFPSAGHHQKKDEGIHVNPENGKYQFTTAYWLKNHMPKTSGNIFDRFMADLK